MNYSTPESPKKSEPLHILLLGPPGSGKTALSMQFPGVAFVDCDRNLDGPERFLRSKNKTLSYGYVPVTLNDKGVPLPVEDCFDAVLRHTSSMKDDPTIQTVVIDGLTMINEFIVRKVLAEQGNKKVMEPHFWGPFKSHLMALLVKTLRSLNKTTIVTAHEYIIEKPSRDPSNLLQAQVIGYRPAVQGGLTDYLGGFFSDMYRCTCIAAPGGRMEYRLQVVRDNLSDLKNSLGLPSDGFTWKDGELGYEKLRPYLEKAA